MSVQVEWPGETPAITGALARFTHRLDTASLDGAVVLAAKRHLLDSIGACVAGASQPMVRDAASLLQDIGASGSVPVPGTSIKADVLSAIYLAAAATHAIELDDGNREGSIHPGTVVVPALLATAYARNLDGPTVLAALVAGYEVAVSLAEVLHPHASRRGFQTTGVVGVVGAAAAVAKVLGLGELKIEKAMGIAASSGAGLFAYLTGGGNIKKLHPAHAAREGAFAALLAERGVVEGPLAVAETKAGIFQAFGGLYPRSGSVPRHGIGQLAITRCYLKPYPCCRHIHPALDALLELRAQHRIVPDDVTSVQVGTYSAAMPHATLGWDTFTTAQLSFPYVMATALRHGVIDLESFSDARRSDCRVPTDAAKVQVREDAQCCEAYPRHGPASVSVVMRDGTRHDRSVEDPLGCPEVPLSDVALFEKFRMMMAGQFSADQADKLIAMIWNLEELGSIRPIVDRLCPTSGSTTVPSRSLLKEAS